MASQHDAGPALVNQFRVANELNSVAQALLVVQQNGLTRKRSSSQRGCSNGGCRGPVAARHRHS